MSSPTRTNKKVYLPDETVIKLVEEVKNRKCIWDTEDNHYNDRYSVITAWKEIGNLLDMPDSLVKKKWKNLRDLFKREAKQYKPKTLEEYYGRWRHFSLLWFLHKPDDYIQEADDTEDVVIETIDEDEEEQSEPFIKFEANSPDRTDFEVYLDDPIDTMSGSAKRRRYNDDDYDIMYLKSLTPYFRQLDPIRKLVVRSKIQDMLMNEIAAQNGINKKIRNS